MNWIIFWESKSHLVSDVLENSGTFVQEGSVVGDQRRHVALGVDGVVVATAGGLVRRDVHLLDIDLEAGGDSGDEGGSAAGSGGVVQLGHCVGLVELREVYCFGFGWLNCELLCRGIDLAVRKRDEVIRWS